MFSLFDHPHFSALLLHEPIAALFSADAELAAMLRFEAALAVVEAEQRVIPQQAATAIVDAMATFAPDANALAAGVARDGLVVPALIALLRDVVGTEHGRHVHFGATSQDVIDSSLILRIKAALAILRHELGAILGDLAALGAAQGKTEVMGRTRMQRALPIAMADRIATWASPLEHHLEALVALERRVLAVQLGGPVGTLEKLGARGPAVRAALAKRLELADPGRPWHAERDRMTDLAHWLAQVSGALGKIGQDLVLMAQNEVGEAVLAVGGLSSAMAHKRNPVLAEVLIALARLNAGQLAAMHQALVHEGERSGAAWTLEWLVLPEMIATTAASLKVCAGCLQGLEIRSGASSQLSGG
jgi:3-carboxy-cis,cis-muconate cycloisomerase